MQVLGNELHDVGFGVFFKGGCAYGLFARNRMYRTGELGIAAGFDTGKLFTVGLSREGWAGRTGLQRAPEGGVGGYTKTLLWHEGAGSACLHW